MGDLVYYLFVCLLVWVVVYLLLFILACIVVFGHKGLDNTIDFAFGRKYPLLNIVLVFASLGMSIGLILANGL